MSLNKLTTKLVHKDILSMFLDNYIDLWTYSWESYDNISKIHQFSFTNKLKLTYRIEYSGLYLFYFCEVQHDGDNISFYIFRYSALGKQVTKMIRHYNNKINQNLLNKTIELSKKIN